MFCFKQIFVRIPDDLFSRALKDYLKKNKFVNKGYILEGFPRNYTNCEQLFLNERNELEGLPTKIYLFSELMTDEVKNRAAQLVEEDERYTPSNVQTRIENYVGEEEGKTLGNFFEEREVEIIRIEPDWPEEKVVEQARMATVTE